MTDGFQITVEGDTITVATDAFSLVFDLDKIGIVSFKYDTSGTWHEGVESGTTPPILFGPYYSVQNLEGNLLYPMGGESQTVEDEFPWFVRISQNGYLRNSSIPNCTDFKYEVLWTLWPSGRLYCRIQCTNESDDTQRLLEEAYRLNPADDQDIQLGRDDPPNLKWFGFFSNNTGSGENDLSHDAVVVPFTSALDQYGTSGNTNRIYRAGIIDWLEDETITREFLLALSVNGSWGDCTDALSFQMRGDDLSADITNPDPLDGSANAGDVLTGTLVGDGFDETGDCYTVESV